MKIKEKQLKIAYEKVLEALAALGIDDPDDVKTVKQVVIDPYAVTVLRIAEFVDAPNGKVDNRSRLFLTEDRARIDHGQVSRHPFEDAVLREEDKALPYVNGVRPE